MTTFMGLLLAGTAIFLILLVLVQRGRGGGLAGALGGMGGQSAFGAKAGDVFTRITIVTAVVRIVLCVVAVKYLGGDSGGSKISGIGSEAPAPASEDGFRAPLPTGETTDDAE